MKYVAIAAVWASTAACVIYVPTSTFVVVVCALFATNIIIDGE